LPYYFHLTIECTADEDFSVNITDEEAKLLKDENGEIRYEKVFQWCLPRSGEDDDNSGRDCPYEKCPGWNIVKVRPRA
jgi:hypothetical protein